MTLLLIAVSVGLCGVFSYFYTSRFRLLSSSLMSFPLAVLAYAFRPYATYDLTRHHDFLVFISDMSVAAFTERIAEQAEPLRLWMSYAIAHLGDINLLQGAVVWVTYAIIFYILRDFVHRKQLGRFSLVLAVWFVLATIPVINFFSGLWNVFAFTLFSLAFYRDVSQKGNKILTWGIYILPLLIHSSAFFLLALLVLFKVFRQKLSVGLLLSIVLLLVGIPLAIEWLASVGGVTFFAELLPMYNAYFVNSKDVAYLYDSVTMSIILTKTFVIMLACFLTRRSTSREVQGVRTMSIIVLLAAFILSTGSLLSLRYVQFAQLISLGMFTLALHEARRPVRSLFIAGVVALSVLFTVYQVHQVMHHDFELMSVTGSYVS